MQTAAFVRRQTEDRCRGCAAIRDGFCGDLSRPSLADLAARSHRSFYEQGAEIAAQGESFDRVGVISSGLVKIAMITETGEAHILQILRPGQVIGDPSSGQSAYACEAATAAAVCWLSRGSWSAFLSEDPRRYQDYLATMSAQIEEARHSVVRMRGRNTLQRLAFWVLEQCPWGEAGEAIEVEPAGTPRDVLRAALGIRIRILLTRRDLASLLDMTVETLCRALHQLDDKRAIRLIEPDLLEVVDAPRLRALGKWPDEAVHRALRLELPRGAAPGPIGARCETAPTARLVMSGLH